jgi:subtilase family serine protease/subtilisin-like proprotein convertase family protein
LILSIQIFVVELNPMKKRYYASQMVLLSIVLTAAFLFAPASRTSQAAPGISPQMTVQRAWELAQEIGAYHFATAVDQTTFPAPAIANVGQSSHTETYHLEGDVNLPEQVLNLMLWQDGGNLVTQQDGVEIRIEKGRAQGRVIEGNWQEIDNFSGAFAPGSDPMAYLAGARNIQELGGGSTAGPIAFSYTRYSFEVDGPAFAAHIREQLEQQLRATGELPPGMSLDTPRAYRQMSGQGEIWLDGDGLPLRLQVDLEYPHLETGERIMAEIQTDFSRFQQGPVAALDFVEDPLAWMGLHLGLPDTLQEWEQTTPQLIFWLLICGIVVLCAAYRRSKLVYTALVVVVILSMVVTPLLESQQVAAFYEQQEADQLEAEQRQMELAANQEAQDELLSSNWDAQQDPLAASIPASIDINQTAAFESSQAASASNTAIDTDLDGITDEIEKALNTEVALADSDGDSLDDGVEFMRLGTDPLAKDSDGDGIYDNVEVGGFTYDSKNWYLDPNSADTNNDGRIDTEECPTLVAKTSLGSNVCQDTDGDKIPDVFDRDDDGDGVSDRIDLFPEGITDRNGRSSNGSSPTPFTGAAPFSFKVKSLTQDKPVFVDFQLRPDNPDHLTYALNVLDWPAADTAGQIQHVKQTTFASGMTAEQQQASPTSANGDMRLIPMMEISISGSAVPLALTAPEMDVELQGDIAGSVHLQPNSNNQNSTHFVFSFENTSQVYTAKLYQGNCAALGTLLTSNSSVQNNSIVAYGHRVVEVADGEHALTISDGTDTVCATIGNIINGPYTDKMIDPAPLEPYGITIRELDQNGKLGAYIPLNIVPDETGGGRAAFTARMVYQAGVNATWLQAQEVRLVWLVQMLTDSCDTTNFEPQGEDESEEAFSDRAKTWCANPANRTPDISQIVQTYDESWYLTGLTVREDHGLDVAVVYEDPTNGDLTYHENLWQLARGLSSIFLTARNCEDSNTNNGLDYDPDQGRCHQDNYRDLTIYSQDQAGTTIGNSNIYDRFDASGSVPDGDDRRWGIPKNALQVERERYPSQDYSAYQAMTMTPAVLDNFSHDAVPTLLFAREEHYRSADLTGISLDGDIFEVDMSTSIHPRATIAGLKWMPFRYNADLDSSGQEMGWEPYPIAEYWDQLELKYTDFFNTLFPDDSEAANLGRAVMARSYYISLVQGLVQQVHDGTTVLSQLDPEGSDSDSFLSSLAAVGQDGKAFGKKIGFLVVAIAKATYNAYGLHRRYIRYGGGSVDWETGIVSTYQGIRMEEEFHGFFESLGDSIKSHTIGPWIDLFSSGTKAKIGGAIALAGAVAVVGLTIYGATQQNSVMEGISIVLIGLNVIMTIQGVVSEAVNVIKAAELAGSLSAAIRNGFSQASNNIKSTVSKGAVVGLIIGVAVTWAALGVQIGLSYGLGGGMSRMALANAIAGAIAATVVAVIMFIIAAIPVVGQIIAAIIGLIDAVISLFCNIFLSPEEQESNAAAKWFCGGITGLVTNILTVLIYSGNVMVELYPEDYTRLEFSNFTADDLVDPDKGIVVGNSVRYGVGITNTIDISPLPDNLGAGYRYQYNDSNLRSSAFVYDLSITNTVELHENLDRKTISDWQYVDGDSPDWGDFGHTWRAAEPVYITRDLTSPAIEFTEAGINRPVSLYLLEGWAIPSQNCIVGICTIWTDRGTENYDLGSGVIFDVFPATLDGFYQLSSKEGGFALSWGQTGETTFPRLADADGDGVLYYADLNDNNPDSDGDGLLDGYEIQVGSLPNSKDGDGDGLRDDLELLAGTNPLRPDSDGDGLSDGEEVFHLDIFDQDSDGKTDEWLGGWSFVYDQVPSGALKITWVVPSPLNANSDGDALADFQESAFGLNPTWASNPNVLTFESTVSEKSGSTYLASDGFVQPGDTLYYEAALKNELYNRWAHGLLSTDFPGVLDDNAVDPQSFLLYPQEEQVLSGEVPVANTAATGVYSLTQTAGALISDWTALSQGAALWFPFEDSTTAVTFADRSGSIPPNDGTCTNPVPGVGCVPIKTDGVSGGAIQFDGSAYISSDFDPTESAFAISLWFKTTQTNGGLFSVTPSNDRVIYLQNGKVKAKMNSASAQSILSTNGNFNDGQWHHLVFTYAGSSNKMALYIDGTMESSGSRETLSASTHGINIGYAGGSGVDYFIGKLDDVRIFDSGLTEAQVQVLFNQPVLDLRFDGNSGWSDHSIYTNNASCSGSNCPDRASGIDGNAANFNGQQYLTVTDGGDGSLDLRLGQFAIGAWIFPTGTSDYCYEREADFYPTCQAWQPQPQGILGYKSADADAYPSLQRVDRKLRFKFGSAGYLTTGDVLTPYEWNHVIVTFDGNTSTLKIFVNGKVVAEDSTRFNTGLIPNTSTLTIGRTNGSGRINFTRILVWRPGDVANEKGEICIAYRSGGSPWLEVYDQEVGSGSYDIDTTNWAVNGTGELRIWEDDGGQHCVTDSNKNNYDPKDDGDEEGGRWTFNTNEVSQGSWGGLWRYGFKEIDAGMSGIIFYVYDNDSTPFRGRVDDVQIYKKVLDDSAVNAIYQNGILAMNLSLDDPPGESVFQDDSGNMNGTCSGTTCPTTGVAGRLNQAAWFDGGDAIEANLNVSENAYATSFWFQSTCSTCGLFSTDQGTLAAQGHDRDIYLKDGKVCAWVSGASGNEELCSTAASYADGNWHQVVHSLGGNPPIWPKVLLHLDDGQASTSAFSAKYYDGDSLSGDVKCTLNDTWPISHDWGSDEPGCSSVGANGFSVRWTGDFYFAGGTYTFRYNMDDGLRVYVDNSLMIDDWNHGAVYPETQVEDAYISAGKHTVKVEYQEKTSTASVSLSWSPLFNDGSGNDYISTCSGNSCPKSVAGKMGRALEFDGSNDYILIEEAAAIEGHDSMAVTAWIKTSSSTNQVIANQPYYSGSSWWEYVLSVQSNGKVRWQNIQGNIGFDLSSTKVVNDGQWHHIVAVRDNRNIFLYVDGKLEANTYTTGGVTDLQKNLTYIGKRAKDNAQFFQGQIDELTIYNQALTAGDAQMLYFNQRLYVDGVMQAGGFLGSSNFSGQNGVVIGLAKQASTDYLTGSIDDLRVYQTGIAQSEVDELYNTAPIIQLHLDDADALGAGRFIFADEVDSNYYAECQQPTCPDFGFNFDGQLGTAVDFDGVDDAIAYSFRNLLNLPAYTLNAWVLPTEVKDKWQTIAARGFEPSSYGLFIKPNSMTVSFVTYSINCTTRQALDAQAPLIQNVWNHIVATFDGNTMTIYINGQPQGSLSVSGGICQPSTPLRLGYGYGGDSTYFTGRIDEVALYNHVLTHWEVADIFNYQAKWVEERQSHDITVDANNPTVALDTTGSRLPNTDVQLLITASDATSGIAKAELGVQKAGLGNVWTTAPACQDAYGNSAWCPTFTPFGEGSYTLRARATDWVGHTQTTSAVIYVDDKAPTATFDFAASALLNTAASTTQPRIWKLSLSGTIGDPQIGSVVGSGVAPESIQVSLIDSDGSVIGLGTQLAKLTGTAWSLDYLLDEADPSGGYTVKLTAVDKIALRAGIGDTQRARHTLTATRAIQVDAAPAQAYADLAGLPLSITDPLSLAGQASERPVPVLVEWTTDAAGEELGLSIQCGGLTRYQLTAGQLPPRADSYSWEGITHQGQACQVNLSDSGANGGTSGLVKVCGETVATWDGSFASSRVLNFTANVAACGSALNVAGVGNVETAFMSVLPGPTHFNETPPVGEMLHLPFEDQPSFSGYLYVHDVSGEWNGAVCNGSTCPATGQVGHQGSAVMFDGLDDLLYIHEYSSVGSHSAFSAAVWLYPTQNSDGVIFYRTNVSALRWAASGEIQWNFNNANPGSGWQGTGYFAPLNTWTHITLVYDNGLISTYANGALVDTFVGAGALPYYANKLQIGSWDSSMYFTGMLDELRLFNRAVSTAEVRSLFLGSAPVLHLPLDEAWAGNGAALPDISGWSHHGLLYTGAYDLANKAVPGKVGPYALNFDGNDYVTIPDDPGLDLQTFSLAAWLKPNYWTYNINPLVVKGAADGSSVNYGLYINGNSQLTLRFYNGSCATQYQVQSTQVLQLNQWSHVAATYDGTQVVLYINGQSVKSEAIAASVCQNAFAVRIGQPQNATAPKFKGLIDDLLIYPRALQPLEVQALFAGNWKNAATTPTGSGITQADWTAVVPAGIEGTYRLDLRDRDVAGHVSNPEAGIWQGEIDTLDPRLTLEAELLGENVRYTTTAQDFNLTQDGFNTPCGAGMVTHQQYFVSPWYRAISLWDDRLYELGAVCERSVIELPGEVGAYDTPGIARGVVVSGTLAYVADGAGGLQIIDISNPVLPQSVSTLPVGYPYQLTVAPGGPASAPDFDLTIDNIQVAPSPPEVDAALVISVTIRNQGSSTATNFNTVLYQDHAPTACEGGLPIWTINIAQLAAGQSTVVAFSHSGLSNQNPHTFHAQVDAGCAISETDEGNNIAGPLNVTAVQAELVISTLTIEPASPVPNQPITITFTITNEGTGDAVGFKTSVYTGTLGPNCYAVGWASEMTAALVPGASKSFSFVHPGFPATGWQDFLAFTDSDCAVNEADEFNNQSWDDVEIVAAPQPDLVVTNLYAETATPLVGQSFVVTVTVENQGAGAAGAFDTSVYSNTIEWDSARTIGLLPAASATMTFTHPGFSATGIYTITAFADVGFEVLESLENNNGSSVRYLNVISAVLPDLTVEDLTIQPAVPLVNQSFEVSATLKNVGGDDASGTEVSFYFDHVPSSCDEGSPDWNTVWPIALAAGATTVITWTHTFTDSGAHQLYAQVDAGCSVLESNEANNIFGPLEVTVITPDLPDLVVESIATQPISPTVNQPFSITIVVKNQGTQYASSFDTATYINNVPTTCSDTSYWVTDLIVGGLGAGMTTTLTYSYPGFSEGGPNDIAVMADAFCVENEINENNNVSVLTVDVQPLLLAGTSGHDARPVSLGQFALSLAEAVENPASPAAMDAGYTYAFIADSSYGLRVVDVSNPSAPVEVGDLDLPGFPRDVAVAGAYAFVVSQWSGLYAIDVSNPGYPAQVDFYATPGAALGGGGADGIFLSGSYAYIADGQAGLRVINISNPADLQPAGSRDTSGYAFDVVVLGQYAYVADGGSGLQVIDIANPANPQIVGSYNTPYQATGVVVDDGLAYVADSSGGLQVIDISDPANPQLLRSFDTPGYAEELDFANDLAYVADSGSGMRVINPTGDFPQAMACDTAGHCTTVVMSQPLSALAQVALAENPQAQLYYPLAESPIVKITNLPAVLDSNDPFTITGYATSTLTTLDVITVTADGAPLPVTDWASGGSESDWQAAWTPATDGPHVIQATVRGADSSTATDIVTVTVDTQAPTLNITPTVYTSTHYYEPRTLSLAGIVTDAGGVSTVEVLGLDGVWHAAVIHGDNWRAGWRLGDGALPDNQAFTIQARATDVAGHVTTIGQPITVDVMLPAPVDLTLSNVGQPLDPGDILRTSSANLTLEWTASSDGSGLDDYQVGWTTQIGGITTQTGQVVSAAGPLTANLIGLEGQRVSVQLGIEDQLGNQRWQDVGSVYVDSPLTPDFISLTPNPAETYRGWMDSDCTLLGIDRRASRTWTSMEQNLYATWDAQALRLAWVGADWDTDDLFIYLDTVPGGGDTAYDPYGATPAPQISLPDGMLADALVWVQGSTQATLLAWTGGAWVVSDQLSVDSYQLSAYGSLWIADLYLPFDKLGTAVGSSLDLLAFATEGDLLSLWAALPNTNLLNSTRVVAALPDGETGDYRLSHRYHWDALDPGICPNGSDLPSSAGPYPDTELQVGLASDPTGVSYSLLGDGLYWLQDLLLGSPPPDVASQLGFLSTDQPPVGAGQEITFTLTYRNRGMDTAYGVYAEVEAQYTLALPDGDAGGSHQIVPLGDIAPGAEGELTFRGVIDTGRSSEPWATAAVQIFDEAHPDSGEPVERLWSHLRVDRERPQFFGFQQPVYLLGPGMNTLSGYAYDEGGIASLEIQAQGTLLEAENLNCPVDVPYAGIWSCAWSVSGLNGMLFDLQLRATDSFGLVSDWGPLQTFMLDTEAPAVTLDNSVIPVVPGSLFRNLNLSLYGDVTDNGGLGRVDVCLQGDCQQADLRLEPGQGAVVAEDIPETPMAINSGTTCNAGAIVQTFEITETFTVGDVHLGLAVDHERRDDLQVTLISPDNTIVRVLTDDGISGTDFQGADWWLNDAAPASFADLKGDHDPSAPFYEYYARPFQPLNAFLGEDSQGTWQLQICDLNPASADGTYQRSMLALTPQDVFAKAGRWSHQVQTPVDAALDYVEQQVRIYGQDLAGNRSLDPLTINVIIDNVAPVITVTQALSTGVLGGSGTVLRGLVSEGGPVAYVTLHITPPNGESFQVRASREGQAWYYKMPFEILGSFEMWVIARDLADNTTLAGPYSLTIADLTRVYLPLVFKNYSPTPIVYENNFEDRVGIEWTHSGLETAPNGEVYLGQFNNDTVTLMLTDLPKHQVLTLSFDLYIIRSWDGNTVNWPPEAAEAFPFAPTGIIGPDEWQLVADGQTLLRTTFSNWDIEEFHQAYPGSYPGGDFPARTGASATNTLGYTFGSFSQDTTYHLTFTFDHDEIELRAAFSATGLQIGEDEYWGIDNVVVTLYP